MLFRSYLCISLFTITAYVSIFHMLSMLVSKKTISAVTCLLLFIGLFLLAVNIQSRIFAPQYLTDYIMTADGYTETTPYPNPKYLTGMAKEVYKFFFDFLPSGQSLQIASEMVKHPALIALYSLGITILTTLAGILGFQKKDLN